MGCGTAAKQYIGGGRKRVGFEFVAAKEWRKRDGMRYSIDSGRFSTVEVLKKGESSSPPTHTTWAPIIAS